jgi:uncharacterized protein
MLTRLPEFVDPWRLADQGKSFSGQEKLRNLSRLRDLMTRPGGEVAYELRFGRDEGRWPRIKGWVRTTLNLECQRCLGELGVPVDAVLDLAVIEVAGEADALPESCEPVLAEDGRLRLLDIIEEELLLAMPQVPRHEAQYCAAAAQRAVAPQDGADTEQTEVPESPFAVLAGMKTKRKN